MLFCPFPKLIQEIRHEGSGIAFWCSHVSVACGFLGPFLIVEGRYCGTSVTLLTIEFPWRHSLPQYSRVLGTYAFRMSDLAYVDMTAGPATDIALLDRSEIEAEDMSMQPPILVECIGDRGGSQFRFVMKTDD